MKLVQLFCSGIFMLCLGCISVPKDTKVDWCDQPIRSQFKTLEKIPINSDWFKVYKVGVNTYAIAEPFNFQEVISYLILGEEKALLFDTGMGMASIAAIVKELTQFPVIVLNSHTHYDHIGGNYEFDHILAMNTSFTKGRASNGLPHNFVRHEVRKEALCLNKLSNLDTLNYHIKPFQIEKFIEDTAIIDLGNRSVEVITVPGHTPDAIALKDDKNGYLWTGDTFYEAPIWLFDEGTDLKQYQKSIEKLASLDIPLKKVFPAHNTPVAEPRRLRELVTAFDKIIKGEVKPNETNGDSFVYEFQHFSFVIRKALLSAE